MKLSEILSPIKEDATAGATAAGDIADVRTTIGSPRDVWGKNKKKKKKKELKFGKEESYGYIRRSTL